MKGSNWFVLPTQETFTEAEWKRDLELLQTTHDLLREAVMKVRPADIQRKKPGMKVTVFMLLTGVASHDVYHAGQISLLKRMMRG